MKAESLDQLYVADYVINNEDMLIEILLRLPVKSLVRFKCVSKHWKALISDPKFRSKYIRFTKTTPPIGIFINYPRNLDIVNYVSFSKINTYYTNFPFKCESNITIRHFSHGLALCSTRFRDKGLIVCNFATGKSKTLTERLEKYGYKDYSWYLIFDPMKSLHYRVVVVSLVFHEKEESSDDYSCYRFEIYSSETGSWKNLPFIWLPADLFLSDALYAGEIHWIKRDLHVRINIDTEKIIAKTMPPLPTAAPEYLFDDTVLYLGECGVRLLLVKSSSHSCESIKIYEMDKGYCGWTEKLLVNMNSNLISSFPESFGCGQLTIWEFSVLCFVNRGNGNDLDLVLAIPEKIISYRFALKTLEVLQDLPFIQFPYSYDTYPFVPTLYPFDHDDGSMGQLCRP